MILEPIVEYDCPLGGRHAIPSDDVRVMKSGDGNFIVACCCGEEPLSEVDEQPHPTPDQFVNIHANAPDPSQWLSLDDAADGWYEVNPWEPPEGYTGTRAQRRQRVRERAKKLADGGPSPIDGKHDERDETAREVTCPSCGASAGQKCQRPSGHRVRSCHSDRVQEAVEKGLIDSDGGDEPDSGQQVSLTGWSG